MKVFVGDDSLDVRIIGVGRRFRVGQQQLAVEYVETLVLHRAHVEVIGAKDHEGVEVVLPAVALLVPAHRALQRRHRMAAFGEVGLRRENTQRDLASRRGGELVVERSQIAGDQREQV